MSSSDTQASQQGHSQTRLLIAISEHHEHMLGVTFISHFLRSRENVAVELFFLLPPRKTTLHGPYGTIMGQGEMDEDIFQMHLKRGEKAVNEAREKLLEQGFVQNLIETRFKTPNDALQWNVLDEVNKGRFHAVVLGHRGRTWLERALEGDVNMGEELLHASCLAPLWICNEPREQSRDVLLCLDGSEMGWRMTQHVGAMLRMEQRHRVVMLRVQRENPANAEPPETIFAKGAEILRHEGVADERLATKVVQENNIPKAIINEATEGNFAVVAAGRHGVGQGGLSNLFMGSVTEKLFHKLQHAALWVQC